VADFVLFIQFPVDHNGSRLLIGMSFWAPPGAAIHCWTGASLLAIWSKLHAPAHALSPMRTLFVGDMISANLVFSGKEEGEYLCVAAVGKSFIFNSTDS
jgi:hypothetical protein